MNSYRRAGLAAIIFLTLLWIGCGETFRPVATPIPGPGGDPTLQDLAIVVHSNGSVSGSVNHFNVTGDTNIVVHNVGTDPVHAALLPPQGNRTYVANRASDSVSSYTTFLTSSVVRTISLPPGSAPVFVHSNVNNRMYVAESGSDRVGVIDVTTDLLVAEVVVGNNPVALAGTPNGARLYCVNRDDGTVTVIANIDNAVLGTITVGNTPVGAVMSSNGARLYVLNQADGTVSVIDTATDMVTATLAVGAVPRFLRFDARLLRVYVANTGGNSVSIINADPNSPNFHTVITVAVGTAPTSVAPLPDGTRAYVANSGCADVLMLTGCTGTTVSVIDTNSNTVIRTISLGMAPITPISLDAAPDSTKVFVANRDAQTISDIRTSNDTVVATFRAPKVDSLCMDTATVLCPRQTPVFVLVTP